MKVKYSSQINSFTGTNFVLNELEKQDLEQVLSNYLPALNPNSKFSWKDIFYSFLSIYYCGGPCIEGAKTVLSNQYDRNPFFVFVVQTRFFKDLKL